MLFWRKKKENYPQDISKDEYDKFHPEETNICRDCGGTFISARMCPVDNCWADMNGFIYSTYPEFYCLHCRRPYDRIVTTGDTVKYYAMTEVTKAGKAK